MVDNPAALTDEELAEIEAVVDAPPLGHWVSLPCSDVRRLIAALRASRAEVAALSWATQEYDEDTGYCLCGCCRHGI